MENERIERANNEKWITLDDLNAKFPEHKSKTTNVNKPETPEQKEKVGKILPVVPVNAPLAKDTPANTPEKPEPAK